MKKRLNGRLYGIAIVLSSTILFISCSQKSDNNTKGKYTGLPFYNTPEMTPEWISEDSSYYDSIHTISDFSFINQRGEAVTFNTIKGKISIVNFFFTICPGICPKMMKNLQRIQENYNNDDKVVILSHSVTPWIDSVATLEEYAEVNNIYSKNWHLLTGGKKQIYSQARLSYFADEGFGKGVTDIDDFLHTENIMLIDGKGRVRGVYSGTLPIEMKRLMEDIETLKKGD